MNNGADRAAWLKGLEAASLVALVFDARSGSVLAATKAAAHFYKCPLLQIQGRHYGDFETLSVAELAMQVTLSLEHGSATFDSVHRDGRGDTHDVQVRLFRVADGPVNHFGVVVRDVSGQRRTERAIKRTEERYRLMLESIQEVVYILDSEGRLKFLNRAWETVTGIRLRDSLERSWLSFVHAEDRATVAQKLERVRSGELNEDRFECRIAALDGDLRWLEIYTRSAVDQETGAPCLTGTLSDVTRRRFSDERIRLGASVFEHTHDGVMITDPDGVIVEVNEAFIGLTGYGKDESIGRRPAFLKSDLHAPEFYQQMWSELQSHGTWHGEIWNRRKSGETFPELLTISAVKNPQDLVTHYIGIFSDISVIKSHQQQLERIAHYDALTQLPNRILLASRMNDAFMEATVCDHQVYICYLDIDGFKDINDRFGHMAGDRFLVDLAQRLERAVHPKDTVARLGGDEFVVLLTHIENREMCEQVLSRILRQIAAPFSIQGEALSVSASIGIAIYPDAGTDADTLLRKADHAMYVSKNAGKNRYTYCVPREAPDEPLAAARTARKQLGEDLQLALERRELELYYQPQVHLGTGQLMGVEALLRWNHPQDGLRLPGTFLPHLDDVDLECRIGEWVIESAMQQVQTWAGAGLTVKAGVNVSPSQIERENFVTVLAALEQSYGYSMRQVELEVLESTAMQDLERAVDVFSACREMGVQFALDDFGTGYSSLTYFRRLPVTTLKIDRSFIQDILDNAEDHAIVEGVIGICRALGRTVIAEGVESVDQIRLLQKLGCDVAQGFGIARPMPARDVAAWIETWQAPWLTSLAD